MMSLFNQKSDSQIGGSYMTLLNTVSNLGECGVIGDDDVADDVAAMILIFPAEINIILIAAKHNDA